jgi:arginyl-tRNA synthetase|tara:strand:- start:1020 stop:2684 length:1665 start_codon:yes stop_codon:yes gene_type:complete
MYLKKTEKYILDYLKSNYKNNDLKEIQKGGMLVQKSPEGIDSDFGTSIPLRLAKIIRKNPMDIANTLSLELYKSKPGFISEIKPINPGYINFTISKKAITDTVKDMVFKPDFLNNYFEKKSTNIQIEFVSANPTGPLHVGHIRGAVYGSALAKILEYYGYNIKTEYYINNAGNQILEFGQSILNEILKENGNKINNTNTKDSYKGTYIKSLAKSISKDFDIKNNNNDLVSDLTNIGVNTMLQNIENDLIELGVKFDSWFKETDLFEHKIIDDVSTKLKELNLINKKDGATWFLSKQFGDDRDNVLIKQDGSHTYFYSDIANHYNKFFLRNFDKVINIWGADHQGHIKRTKYAMEALGVKSENLEIKISQMVTIKKGSEAVKISKRSGEYITLQEIVKDVGKDACRYFFLSKAPNTQLTFDINLAKSQNSNNPIYYIQYAHARISTLIKNAEILGIDINKTASFKIETQKEISLSKMLLEFPDVITQISKELEPHHITKYTLDLASEFHSFYQSEKIIDQDNLDNTISKLILCKAIQKILKKSLEIMMISAPENM